MSEIPIRALETKPWLGKALSDLQAAATLLVRLPPLLQQVAYHSQQAIEKTLKGFLTWHGRPFAKTHDLEALGEQCLVIDATLREALDLAIPPTEYASSYRYRGEIEEPAGGESKEALAIAIRVFDDVLARLPAEVHPPVRRPDC